MYDGGLLNALVVRRVLLDIFLMRYLAKKYIKTFSLLGVFQTVGLYLNDLLLSTCTTNRLYESSIGLK